MDFPISILILTDIALTPLGHEQAIQTGKEFDMGYTRVYEFGGIIDWTGEVVK